MNSENRKILLFGLLTNASTIELQVVAGAKHDLDLEFGVLAVLQERRFICLPKTLPLASACVTTTGAALVKEGRHEKSFGCIRCTYFCSLAVAFFPT